MNLRLVVRNSIFLVFFFFAYHAEAVLISSTDTVSISAQVGTPIPPILGGGSSVTGGSSYYPPINPELIFACSDGIDNDYDGLIDWGVDPGCISNLGISESQVLGIQPDLPSVFPTVPFPDPNDYVVPATDDLPSSNDLEGTPIINQSAVNLEDIGNAVTPQAAGTLSLSFLSVLLYNLRRARVIIPASEKLVVGLGALGTLLTLALSPSLYTVASTLLYIGAALLRYLTMLW